IDLRLAKTAPATQFPIERIGFRLWNAGNLTRPQNFYRPFSGLDQRNAPPTPGTPYPAQYPPDFLLVNATGVPVFRTRYGRSVLPSGLSVASVAAAPSSRSYSRTRGCASFPGATWCVPASAHSFRGQDD